jgi:hypothetical protein
MGKGYIYNEWGELEEELELSVDGGQDMWCEKCQEVTYHALVGISSLRGSVYACAICGTETK